MTSLLAEEGENEFWTVVWFPPEGDRAKSFDDEGAARAYAARDEVAEWNPLLEHVVQITVSELVPL